MKFKFQLISTTALALTGASMVHAQAYGNSFGYAEITNLNATSTGGYSVGGVYTTSLGYTSGILGPRHGNYGQYFGGIGNYHFGGGVSSDSAGFLAESSEYNLANPNGQVLSGDYLLNGINVYNSNSFAVEINFVGITSSYSFASQQAVGDSAYGDNLSALIFNQSFALQESTTHVEADTLFGHHNYVQEYSFNVTQGFSGGYYFFGNGSPFSHYALMHEAYQWSVYLGAYSSFTIQEYSQSIGFATSLRTNNGTPAPAAVAPFAVGLLGALRRRNKKS